MTTKASIPPWKKELLLRRNALAKAVDPNASVIAEYLESNASSPLPASVQHHRKKKMVVASPGACSGGSNSSTSKGGRCSSSLLVGGPPSEGVKAAVNTLSSSEVVGNRGGVRSREVKERADLACTTSEEVGKNKKKNSQITTTTTTSSTHAVFSPDHEHTDECEEETQHLLHNPPNHYLQPQSVIFTVNSPPSRNSCGSRRPAAPPSSVTKKESEPGTSSEPPLSPQHPLLVSESTSSSSSSSSALGVVRGRPPGGVTHLQSSTFNSILSGMILASPAIVVTDQEESLLLMDKPRIPKASSSSLDSDDGSSSGSSASSTEELRYGPGFVSRLKSRYMRSALRSSHFNNLRRTASLEDFLDKDEEEEEEVEVEVEVEEQQPPLLPRRNWAPTRRGAPKKTNNNSNNTSKTPSSSHHPLRSRDSMKRCKSVEVLSRNRLPSTSSDAIPPPLPPKTGSSIRTPLDLNATKGLIPDRSLVLRERKPKELPAQDIVKQTRKLFESKSISSSPNVIISSHSKALRKREEYHPPPALPLKSIAVLKSSRVERPSPPKGGPLPNNVNVNNSSSKNPLELPPKQIGIIRPITRPPSTTTSSNFVHEQNLKNKASVAPEVPLVSDKKINKNVQTTKSSTSSSEEEEKEKEVAPFLHKKSTLKSVSPVVPLVPAPREEPKEAQNMCEFKSIVLKEVKKELSGIKPESSSLNTKTQPDTVKSRLSPCDDDGIPEEDEVHERRRDLMSCKSESQTGIVESKNITFRDSWKARNEGKNTLVFNFINSKKDVSHIENDGLDFTKRNKKLSKPGVILLDSVISDESTDDDGAGLIKQITDDEDEEELNRPPSPCSIVFIGGNLISGKSSLRSCSSRSSDRKMNISFSSSLEEVFEYPSFESTLRDDEALSKNGGLGSYTPSKNQLSETPFQLGVSRTPSHSSKDKSKSSSLLSSSSNKVEEEDQVLRPVEDAVSWSGSSSSSDILF